MLTTLFYISFLLFLIGIVVKFYGWFIGSMEGKGRFLKRFYAFLRGVKGVFLGKKGLLFLRALFGDVFLQVRTYREDRYRWVMHLLIYWGFGVLVVTHAFGKVVFDGYFSTAMPHIFLRDLFGLMVLVGAFMAFWRRWVKGIRRFISNKMDVYALLVVALVVLSGFLLKAVKVTSYRAYLQMVEEYAPLGEEELKALEAYWVKEMGLVSPHGEEGIDQALLEQGAEVHATSCAPCHADQKWAFVSYGLSKAFRPFALVLDRIGGAKGLWWVHVGVLLLALPILPFTKFLHLLTVPLSLLLNGVMSPQTSNPENLKTKQMIELDACVHCGTCTSQCAVGIASVTRSNLKVLPSEKIAPLRSLAKGKAVGQGELSRLLEGVLLCTNCLRCTVVCPSGIDLQELWFDAREALFRRGMVDPLLLSPLSFYRGLRAEELEGGYPGPVLLLRQKLKEAFHPGTGPFEVGKELSVSEGRFWPCFACQTCTNVCPVVSQYECPEEALGLLPHQLMRACALGLRELALSAEMLWKCLTCYQCQEQCPQGVEVTEVILGLKAMALRSLKEDGDALRLVSGL